ARESARLRFWYAPGGYCYDVVDGPAGDDPTLRPNQLIALSLAYPLIDGDQARSALDTVSARLLTPYGLRTLSPDDERYQPAYRPAGCIAQAWSGAETLRHPLARICPSSTPLSRSATR